MATDQGLSGDVVDVDKSFIADGPLSLDEHRQIEFAKLQQPGFGLQPNASAAPESTPQPQGE
jgi:hypothetical protein